MSDISPELEALLRDGTENLERLSDERLREYAVWWLKADGATPSSSFGELAVMAAANAVRTRQHHADNAASEAVPALVQMIVDLGEDIARELKIRSVPN